MSGITRRCALVDQRVNTVIRAFLFPGEDKGSCLLTPLSLTDCYY